MCHFSACRSSLLQAGMQTDHSAHTRHSLNQHYLSSTPQSHAVTLFAGVVLQHRSTAVAVDAQYGLAGKVTAGRQQLHGTAHLSKTTNLSVLFVHQLSTSLLLFDPSQRTLYTDNSGLQASFVEIIFRQVKGVQQ